MGSFNRNIMNVRILDKNTVFFLSSVHIRPKQTTDVYFDAADFNIHIDACIDVFLCG